MTTVFKKITSLVVGTAAVCAVVFSIGLGNNTQKVDAASTLYQTCDFTLKSSPHSAYGDAWAYGTEWNVFGGANNNAGWAYVKFGGKSATLATANPVYVNNVNAMGSAINKVSVSLLVGTLPTNSSVTTWGVKVYSDSALTTQIDESTLSSLTKPTTAIVYDFAPSTSYQTANSTTEWPTASYFKVFFACTNTSTTNGIVWVDKVSFYKDVPFVAVSSVSITDPGSSALAVGTPIMLSADVQPANATDKTVTWASSPSEVVRVESNGRVVPCNNGTVTITATSISDGTKAGSRVFTVSGQDLTTSSKTITTTSLGLAQTYVNGYFGSATIYSLRGVMAKAVDGELQFGNNAAAGQGLLYNVSSYASKIDSIVITTGASGAAVASALYVGSSVNPTTTLVTPTVVGTAATYSISALGDFEFFSFAITGTSGTNYYDSIVVNLVEEATAYAQQFLSTTAGECAALAVSSSTWASLQSSFESLSSDSKNTLLSSSANASGTDIEKAIARYDYIVQKYGYTNFISRVYSARNIDTLQEGSKNLLPIMIISVFSLTVIAIYFFLNEKKKEII